MQLYVFLDYVLDIFEKTEENWYKYNILFLK